jgi:hypothetical protein
MSPLNKINALKLVSPPIGSILLTLFVKTINGTHISEESITVQYWCPYDAGSQTKNGSVQLKLNEPAIEMVSSTSLKLFMEIR